MAGVGGELCGPGGGGKRRSRNWLCCAGGGGCGEGAGRFGPGRVRGGQGGAGVEEAVWRWGQWWSGPRGVGARRGGGVCGVGGGDGYGGRGEFACLEACGVAVWDGGRGWGGSGKCLSAGVCVDRQEYA